MTDLATSLPTAPTAVAARLEEHRSELVGYCYRMLGSTYDAEDAVQETMTRAWRGIDRFEGRAGLRTWLYRIASNVCFDHLHARKRRAMPMDLGGAGSVDEPLAPPLPGAAWIEPLPESRVIQDPADPAAQAETRESIRLALVAALQHLPPRQRAVLILREVLRFEASEVAELLETTVASVNSALQRARATLEARALTPSDLAVDGLDEASRELLDRYVDAFERYDMDALKALLHEDAQQSMPPFPLWLRGRADMLAWMAGPGAECEGSRLVPLRANGRPAFAQYRSGGAVPWSIQVLEIVDGRIAEITFFLELEGARVFELFGLPPALEGAAPAAPATA